MRLGVRADRRALPGEAEQGQSRIEVVVLGALVVMIAAVPVLQYVFQPDFVVLLAWGAPGLLVVGLLFGIFVRLGRIVNKRQAGGRNAGRSLHWSLDIFLV
jgi:hypothetical protein